MIRAATSRTWPTEPGAPVSSAACSVCTESMTQTSGRSASIVASTVSRSVSASDRAPAARARPQPLGAQPDLRRRLLAGDVERAPPGAGEVAERHRRQGRLADPGRAAEQDERAGDQPAARARDRTRRCPWRAARRRSARTSARRHRARRRARAAASPRPAAAGARLLDERVPRAAARALPEPARLGVAAVAADVLGVRSGHR